jgi:hypothetical protein
MIQWADLATFAASSEVEVTAIAYEEAAAGYLARALRWALEDLLATEGKLDAARGPVSCGYVRAALPASREAR